MFCKVSEQGNVVEVTRLLRKNDSCPIERLNADEYVVISEGTGEIHEVEHGTSRVSDVKSVRRTFRKLRALINNNCTEPANLRWITLTYKENMTSTRRLYDDFRKFMQRFRYRYGDCEYIVVAEPQERGAWHMHLIAIFPGKAPYIPKQELYECWSFGFVNCKAVKSVDNIGAYLSAYVTNLEVDDGEQFDVEAEVDGKQKKYVKGARVYLYPAGMQIYRHSRGVKAPDERWVTESELEGIIGGLRQTFKREYEYQDESGFRQVVVKEFYNRLRVPGKQ